MENLSPMRLSMGSQFFLSSGLMLGTNRPSAVFESAENMYTDSYPANDSRNSFSNRLVSSQLPSVRQTASSVSLFPPFGVGESSLPTDWGQSNTNMPVLFNESGQPDLIDKPERESSRDPAFFNQFFNEMPPVREDLDFGNGRISELSVMEHDRRTPEVCVFDPCSRRVELCRPSAGEFPLHFASKTTDVVCVGGRIESRGDDDGSVSCSRAGRSELQRKWKSGAGEKRGSAESGR